MPSCTGCWITQRLTDIGLTSFQLNGTRPIDLKGLGSEPGFHSRIPRAFSSLEEARNSFDYHWNGCIQICNQGNFQKDPVSAESNRQYYLKILRAWSDAFEAFVSKNIFDMRSMQGAKVLQMSQAFALISLQSPRIFKETDWDPHVHQFDEITILAGEMISTAGSTSTDQDSGQRSPSFSLDMNLVIPLYAVAHKCRDPFVRRKAVTLLKSSPRQEGIWDSVLAGRVAEKLINMEEHGLGNVRSCHDVPESARICSVDASFDMEGKVGTINYTRQRHGPSDAQMQARQEWVQVNLAE